MRTRASFVLSVVALGQLLLLGGSLALLVLRLGEIRESLVQLGREEQEFLKELGDAESDLYRTSILLRDNIILAGPEQQRANRELIDLLKLVSAHSLPRPRWISTNIRRQIDGVEAARNEYLARATIVTSWDETRRQTLGPIYLSQQLAPTREKFVTTSRQIATLVRTLRESRGFAMAESIDEIQGLVVRILAGAALCGFALAGVAIWRFRHFEKERDTHIEHLRDAEEGLRALSQRLVESQEVERKKLSRELHDEVGQLMTAMRVQIGQIEPVDEASRQHIQQASELAERSLRSVREMARGLRPAMLDDLGLAPALKWLGRDFSKNTPLEVDVHIEGDVSGMDEPRRTCLYRIVQESLTNCAKHSGSTSARVILHDSPGEVVLTVEDHGAGFTPKTSRGIGLLGMRERVEELGGRFAVITTPGFGTLIRANLPKEFPIGEI